MERTEVLKRVYGNPLGIPQLGLSAFTAWGPGYIPGGRTKILQCGGKKRGGRRDIKKWSGWKTEKRK